MIDNMIWRKATYYTVLQCNSFLKLRGLQVSVLIFLKIQRSSKMEDDWGCFQLDLLQSQSSRQTIHNPMRRPPTATKAYSKNLIQICRSLGKLHVARHEQEKKSSRRRSPSSSRSRSPPRYDLTMGWLKLWIWDGFYTWMLGDEEVVFIQKLNETK